MSPHGKFLTSLDDGREGQLETLSLVEADNAIFLGHGCRRMQAAVMWLHGMLSKMAEISAIVVSAEVQDQRPETNDTQELTTASQFKLVRLAPGTEMLQRGARLIREPAIKRWPELARYMRGKAWQAGSASPASSQVASCSRPEGTTRASLTWSLGGCVPPWPGVATICQGQGAIGAGNAGSGVGWGSFAPARCTA